MIRQGILHVGLNRFLASCGHLDEIVLCDAGLPIPHEGQRIELAVAAGLPGLLPLLDLLCQAMVFEAACMAEESLTLSPGMHAGIQRRLEPIPIDHCPHEVFKQRSRQAKGIIRSGEFTPYSNVILVCGCAY
ncbi:MAG: D-ribose pyranase [Planctomycetota bacterium]